MEEVKIHMGLSRGLWYQQQKKSSKAFWTPISRELTNQVQYFLSFHCSKHSTTAGYTFAVYKWTNRRRKPRVPLKSTSISFSVLVKDINRYTPNTRFRVLSLVVIFFHLAHVVDRVIHIANSIPYSVSFTAF